MKTISKQKITQKCAWVGEAIADKTDWTHSLSAHALHVLDQGLRQLEAKQWQAPNFSKADIVIDDEVFLKEVRLITDELENGYGFVVIRGLDAHKYKESQLATLYYLLGVYLGQPVTQNAHGDLLGQVQSAGDPTNKSTRVYETNLYLPYHTDMSDVVGLLSIRKAKAGGLSSVVSFATVYNEIVGKYPEYLASFYHPYYYAHLGEPEPSLSPIFSYWKGKLAGRYLRAYIELGHELRNVPMSQVQKEALDIFDEVSLDPRLRLDMMLEPGDLLFCNNYTVMHSRTEFEDDDAPEKRRKLLRLWLKMDNARELAPEFPGRNGIPAEVTDAV